MKKRNRPSKHFRIIKTNKGLRKVVINPTIKKPLKNKGRITPSDRKIFSQLSRPDRIKEYGGGIDFDKKGHLERFQVTPGRAYEVDLEPDYEVLYHTHPSFYESPPTPEDVVALINSPKQQAEIVFRNGESFIIIDTPRTKKLKSLSEKKQLAHLYKLFNNAAKNKDFSNAWKKALEDNGFRVQINKKLDKTLLVNIEPKD